MPRRRSPEKRKVIPDPKFHDVIVAKFMNHIMKDGKKSVAEKIVYGAFNIVDKDKKSDPVEVFKKALDEVGPVVEVKSRRVGGATYQVPIEVPKNRRFYLASQWIINAAVGRSGKPMSEKLASELISAANGEGGAIKKKDDTHRMAEANKAFAHFR